MVMKCVWRLCETKKAMTSIEDIRNELNSSEFLVLLVLHCNILQRANTVSKYLQDPFTDIPFITEARSKLHNTITITFSGTLEEAKEMATN